MNVSDRLVSVLRRVFDDAELPVGPETTANDVDGWDSLSHVNLIVAVEVEFGIRFSPGQAASFRNVGELQRAIDSQTR